MQLSTLFPRLSMAGFALAGILAAIAMAGPAGAQTRKAAPGGSGLAVPQEDNTRGPAASGTGSAAVGSSGLRTPPGNAAAGASTNGSTGAASASGSPPTDAQPVLGITWTEPTPGTIVVSKVERGSPAEKAGLRPDDVIVSVKGAGVGSAAELDRVLKNLKGGESTSLGVMRGRKEATLKLALPQTGVAAANLLGADLRADGKGHIVVADVSPTVPAAAAGLKRGDIILSVEGQPAESVQNLIENANKIVTARKPGDTLTLVVDRGGQKEKIAIVLPEHPTPANVAGTATAREPLKSMLLGVVVDDRGEMVKVTQVIAQGPAAKAGILPGDVIVGINGQKTSTFTDLANTAAGFQPGQKAQIDVLRGSQALTLVSTAVRNETAVTDVMLDPLAKNPATVAVAGTPGDMAGQVLLLQQRVDQLEATVRQLSNEITAMRGNR